MCVSLIRRHCIMTTHVKLFQIMDKDQDGVISIDEFMEACTAVSCCVLC